MDLAELLEREDLDGDEVLDWARNRAEVLITELASADDELLQLLESDVQIDIEALAARPEPISAEPTPALGLVHDEPAPADEDEDEDEPAPASELHASGYAEHVDEQPTQPVTLPRFDEPAHAEVLADVAPAHDDEPDEEPHGRGRRRVPSSPQPLSADELPPPPEHPRLAEGEPEPMLETVDTGPIDLGTPEADAMIAATSTRAPIDFDMDIDEGDDEHEAAPASDAAQPDEAPAEAASDDASDSDEEEDDDAEEFELVEIDDELLEIVEEADDDHEPPPPPPGGGPPPPPPGGGPPPPPPTPPSDAGDGDDDDDGFDIDMD